MRIITLEDLLIVQTVARGGGVVRAAETLNRVPSNITTRVRRFEERLGQKLFRRQGRGLVLTESGHKLLGHADHLLKLAEEAERSMLGGAVSGQLRLGSLESAAAVRLPSRLSTFHREHGDIAVELRTGSTGTLLEWLRHREIEAEFVSEPFDSTGLTVHPVFTENLVFITARDHPPVARPEDLGAAAGGAFPHGCSYRRCLVEWLAAGGVSPRRFLDLGSYHAIVACVAAGAGAAFVPESVLDQASLGAQVQRHRLPPALARNRTHLVWRDEPSRALEAFVRQLGVEQAL